MLVALLELLLLGALAPHATVGAGQLDASSAGGDKPPTAELPRPLPLHGGHHTDRMQRAVPPPGHQRTAASPGHQRAQQRQHERRKLPHRTPRPTLMDIALEASAREGLNAMADLYGRLEVDIVKHGRILEANHPAALLSQFSAPDEGSAQREMAAYATITATKAFRRNYKHYHSDLARHSHSQKISLRRTALEGLCPPRDAPLCMPAAERYRTHDGTCNNKRHMRWGAAQMPFNRFLPPEYGDGVDSIRDAAEGGTLSSSRFVSLLVHGAKDGEAPLTLMTAQWGQLLDHDLTSTAQPRAINGSVPSCCGRKDFHPSCFPIKVPLDDPWLAPLKVRCLEFLRSAPAQRRDCVLSWREQTNQATSYIDASPIYSNSAKSSDSARVFRNGLLVYGRGNPTDDVCQRGALATQCIRAGDGRSGEQPGLLALHHVWVGEHNRIALDLSQMNPHWSDEKIYQETRRIVGAMFQHITYREFLPVILGREVCKLFDLELLNSGYYQGYNLKVNPTVANSFAAAAFRFGHSLVQNSYIRCDRHHNILSNNVSLHEEFQRGDIGSAGSLHRLIRGLATQRALKRDEFITPELTNHLFQTPGFPFGLDLAAINIQRGRDHGIAPYTAWRVPCGLTAITSWEDLANVVGPESAERINHAYRSVHDIDLFVGGIAERPVVGGLVGPTFACIIAQQFSNSRKGDRFWYENSGFESSFTPAQLHAIRRISLAQVLCRAVGGGTFQPHIFVPAEFPGNERILCGTGQLASIDLGPWLEQDPFGAPSPSSAFAGEEPEQVFDIMPNAGLDTNALHSSSSSVLKENKASFSNRIKAPPENTSHVPNVNFIPNANTGIQRPSVTTVAVPPQKVSDKLDLKRKTQRPSVRPSVKPVGGVNNKLDKSGTRITLNIKNVNRHRLPTTTRRTVVVNNIPIELRTAAAGTDDTTKKTKTKTKKKNTNSSPTPKTIVETDDHADELEARTESTNATDSNAVENSVEEKLTNITLGNSTALPSFLDTSTMPPTVVVVAPRSTINDLLDFDMDTTNSSMTNETLNSMKGDGPDIDPLTHASLKEHKRVQRQHNNHHNTTNRTLTTRRGQQSTIVGKPLNKQTNLTKAASTSVQLRHGTNTTSRTKSSVVTATTRTLSTSDTKRTTAAFLSTTTKQPKSARTTKRGVELRQYQTRPIYTRPLQQQPAPHKVIVDGPNADQYEIEINIRQTNKSPSSAYRPSLTTYPAPSNTQGYHTVGTVNYVDFTSTTPVFPYYQPPPTTDPLHLAHVKRTKPPTIIYLNEHDERTTARPGLFQNFFTFATNGFSPSSRPQAQKEKLPYESSILSSSGSPHSSAVVYSPRPPLQQQSQLPIASSFSQIGSPPVGGGGGYAASSAVSGGNFGSIVGVASANGGDSTFSFNIRPRPEVGTPEVGRPPEGTYGLLPPRRPPTSFEYTNLPTHSVPPLTHENYEPPAGPNHNSPFSTSVNRPQQTIGYYSRTPNGAQTQRKHDTATPTAFTPDDYDYQSKTLDPKRSSSNLTSVGNDYADDDDNSYSDYNDDDDTDGVTPADRYNRDGYLRPQLMLDTLFSTKPPAIATDPRDAYTNISTLDDNYVLPAMNGTTQFLHFTVPMTSMLELLNLTQRDVDYPDTFGKNFGNDILAQDYDEDEDETTESFIATKSAALNEIAAKGDGQHTVEQMAFAPIKVLTKPERPDHWVIYDTPKDKPLLPELPTVRMEEDSEHTIEIPMPIRSASNAWLARYRKPLHKTSEIEDNGSGLGTRTDAGTEQTDGTTTPNPEQTTDSQTQQVFTTDTTYKLEWTTITDAAQTETTPSTVKDTPVS